jgi:hypothetical protein
VDIEALAAGTGAGGAEIIAAGLAFVPFVASWDSPNSDSPPLAPHPTCEAAL